MIVIDRINERIEKRFSSIGVKIKQIETGLLYDDAVDIIPCRYTYEETDIPIDIVDDAEIFFNDIETISSD